MSERMPRGGTEWSPEFERNAAEHVPKRDVGAQRSRLVGKTALQATAMRKQKIQKEMGRTAVKAQTVKRSVKRSR